ncbi:MAG: carboxypeptidase-like regulatory domain-containing protein, partial [Bacteroidia bacterium]|nr:carboxypeptidase-like regulatory domain-containing protein [Bacteroidia bacterium]
MEFFNKYFILPLLIFLIVGILPAQELLYRGKIIDSDNSQALIGATVVEKGVNNGSLSGTAGVFEISTSAKNPFVVVSYLGYESLEIQLMEGETTTIKLKRDNLHLDDVVITGLGIKRQKRELGYSTDNVSGGRLALSNAPNIVNALSGLSPGLQVISPNGVDGGTTRITIRGNNNISGNNQPLIIVDGVPIENP